MCVCVHVCVRARVSFRAVAHSQLFAALPPVSDFRVVQLGLLTTERHYYAQSKTRGRNVRRMYVPAAAVARTEVTWGAYHTLRVRVALCAAVAWAEEERLFVHHHIMS